MIGCERSLQFHRHFYGDEPERVDLCPRQRTAALRSRTAVSGAPEQHYGSEVRSDGLTLTKCCLLERGLEVDGATAVVPWGANLDEVREGLRKLLL